MKKRDLLFVVSVICTSLVCTSLFAASSRSVCNSYCETSKSTCNGGALMGSDGKVSGCTKDGTGCKGTCYTCESGASDSFCASGGSGCVISSTSPETVSCGGRISGTCGGTWSSGCSCTAGSGTPSGTCDPVLCWI